MLFAADGASSMSAYRRERRVAKARGSRLTVRLRVPRGVSRPVVRIVATSAGTSSTRT